MSINYKSSICTVLKDLLYLFQALVKLNIKLCLQSYIVASNREENDGRAITINLLTHALLKISFTSLNDNQLLMWIAQTSINFGRKY